MFFESVVCCGDEEQSLDSGFGDDEPIQVAMDAVTVVVPQEELELLERAFQKVDKNKNG